MPPRFRSTVQRRWTWPAAEDRCGNGWTWVVLGLPMVPCSVRSRGISVLCPESIPERAPPKRSPAGSTARMGECPSRDRRRGGPGRRRQDAPHVQHPCRLFLRWRATAREQVHGGRAGGGHPEGGGDRTGGQRQRAWCSSSGGLEMHLSVRDSGCSISRVAAAAEAETARAMMAHRFRRGASDTGELGGSTIGLD
jgi:hypothetical protein